MKVLDAKGRELEVGAEVVRVCAGGEPGHAIGTYHGVAGNRKSAAVEFVAGRVIFVPVKHDAVRWRTYHVPDLQLVNEREDVGDE